MNSGQQQQQSFHDQSNPQQNQPHMPPGFQNGAQQMSRANLLQQAFLQNSGAGHNNVSRQLELMMAQNPQQQHAFNRMQQQHQMNMPAGMNQPQQQADIFSSSDEARRPSPIPPQGTAAANMALANRRPNMEQLRERGQSLRQMIAANEIQMQTLNAQRAGMSDSVFLSKMRQLQNDTPIKRDGLAKLAKALQMPFVFFSFFLAW
jgi:hypothetical protein